MVQISDAQVQNYSSALSCCAIDAAYQSIQARIYGDTACAEKNYRKAVYFQWAVSVMQRYLAGCVTAEFACLVMQKAGPICEMCACAPAATNPVTPVPPCDITPNYRVFDAQDASQQPGIPSSRSIYIISNTVPTDNTWALHVGQIITGITYVTPADGSIILNSLNSVFWVATPTGPGIYFPPINLVVVSGILTLVSSSVPTNAYLARQMLVEGFDGTDWVVLYSGVETGVDGFQLSSATYTGIRTSYYITQGITPCTYGPFTGTVDTACQILVDHSVKAAVDANFQGSADPSSVYYIVSNVDSLGTTWGLNVGALVEGIVFTPVTVGDVTVDETSGILWIQESLPGQLFPIINGTEVFPATYQFVSEWPNVNAAEGRNIIIEGLIGSTWTSLYSGPESSLATSFVVGTATPGATELRTTYVDGSCLYRYYNGTMDQGEFINLISNRSVNFALSFRTTTGRIAVQDWNGTITAYGSGTPGTTITVNFTVPMSGPFSGNADKPISAYPITSASITAYGGGITLFDGAVTNLSLLDVSTCASLLTLNAQLNQLLEVTLNPSSAPTSVTLASNQLSGLVIPGMALQTLDCSGNDIVDLTIAATTSVTALRIYSNQIAGFDTSVFPNLITYWCRNNPYGTIDVSQNTALQSFICSACGLSLLDIALNTALTLLDCSNNGITVLVTTTNAALVSLTLSNNSVSNLTLTTNTALVTLIADHNTLTGVNTSANTLLQTFVINNNTGVNSVSLTTNTALVTVNVSHCNLSALVVGPNILLVTLIASFNPIGAIVLTTNTLLQDLELTNLLLSSLNISTNDVLRKLYLDNTNIGAIDVTDKPLLTDLRVSACGLAVIYLSMNTALQHFYGDNNAFAVIDFSTNTMLIEVSLAGVPITALDIHNHTSLDFLQVSNSTSLTNLNCSGCIITDLRVSGCTSLNILNAFNNRIIVARIDALFNPLPSLPAGTVNCSGGTNAAPTVASLTKRNLLTTAGWSIATN